MPMIASKDGTNLYVKVWGSGRPVVFIHGWPLSADSWDAAAMAVASAGYKAVAYDRRGFGRSDQPWSGYDYDTLADDLAAVLTATDSASDATLVGFSMGGGEVARYMSRYGGQGVVQTALISSVVPYMLKTDDNPDGAPREVFDAMLAGLKKDRAMFFDAFFRNFYNVGILTHPVSEEVVQWSRSVAMSASLKATLDCVEAFATTDFRPDLPAFTVPTLIVHGTGDKIVPIDTGGRAAARDLPQATLIEYDGAPHGLLASHQDRFAEDLLSFLKG